MNESVGKMGKLGNGETRIYEVAHKKEGIVNNVMFKTIFSLTYTTGTIGGRMFGPVRKVGSTARKVASSMEANSSTSTGGKAKIAVPAVLEEGLGTCGLRRG